MILFSAHNQTHASAGSPMRHFLRVVFMAILIIIVLLEGYYALVLKNKIRKQRELTKQISLELQNLKNERNRLNKELQKYRIVHGDKKDGSTPKR